MRKYSFVSKDILTTILKFGVIALATTTPFFAIAFLALCFDDKYPKTKFRNSFNNLKRNNFIKIKKKKNKIFISLTNEGRNLTNKIKLEDLAIKLPIRWDGKWRIVIFDIPESLRHVRNLLRLKLKQFGFYRLQESVWIFPYDCFKEISLIRDYFNLSQRRLILLTTNGIVSESYFMRIFGLKK